MQFQGVRFSKLKVKFSLWFCLCHVESPGHLTMPLKCVSVFDLADFMDGFIFSEMRFLLALGCPEFLYPADLSSTSLFYTPK